MALFGQGSTEIPLFSRFMMLDDFVERVHVVGGEGYQFPPSGDTVEIPLDAYTKILNDLVLSVQHRNMDAMGQHQEREFSLDAAAHAIQNIILCRLNNSDPCDKVNPFVIDARHLTVLRGVRAQPAGTRSSGWLWAWSKVIVQTAEELGYSFQLEDSYNIDIHAELLCYDVGTEPLLPEDTAQRHVNSPR
ncbi:hypothetical protein BD410DRAFT_843263 [Rickenella mellea]|uniref:Uncharacterized protein n=1 Tax=Rickenella mellea TaxID=50990 RepID=A0A4Y7PR08_9AGAM|nr:hypothetical protein BD410DRAFT_843263 [Rickenella mellea]